MMKGRRYEASLINFEHVNTCIPYDPPLCHISYHSIVNLFLVVY